jgi:hypothetical protein
VTVVSNAVTESVEILRRRLSELDDEREQIVVALRALEGVSDGASAPRARAGRRSTGARASTTRATRATRTRTTRAAGGATARGRSGARNGRSGGRSRRGGGSQADRFLKLVTDNPGITVAQAASKMGMQRANALYSVASRLSREGKVTKQGTGYHAA